MAYHRAHRLDVRIARIFNTFGPSMRVDDGRMIPNFFRQALRSEPLVVFGDGKQTRSIMYVDDLVEGVFRLLCSSYVGPVNLGSQAEVSVLDLARTILRVTGSRERGHVRAVAAGRSEGAPSGRLAREARARLGAGRSRRGGARADARLVRRRARHHEGPRVTDRLLIRNFCIIAHIDHGKSTLADRLLDATNSLTEREKRDQFLDKMDLERERGITIKAQTARMRFVAADGLEYVLNLIDTPGHVDFSYEVSRALQACEGAVLVVDASQGIEAQTLANAYLAVAENLTLIPVANKIDLPSADPVRAAEEIEEVLGLDATSVLPVSAKEGDRHPRAARADRRARCRRRRATPDAPLRALIFDAWFDSVRRRRGARPRRRRSHRAAPAHQADGAGQRARRRRSRTSSTRIRVASRRSTAGEVGIVIAGIKSARRGPRSATRSRARAAARRPALPGFREVKPMVFSGPLPGEPGGLREPARRRSRSSASTTPRSATSPRRAPRSASASAAASSASSTCEIIQERLEREYNLDLIITAPTVRYSVVSVDGVGARDREPGAAARSDARRARRGAVHPRDDPRAARSSSAPCCSSARTAAASSATWRCTAGACRSATSCRSRRSCRTSTTA